MKAYKIFICLLLSSWAYGQDVIKELEGFNPLLGKTWVAKGQWGDGSKFMQEVTFSSKLNGKMITSESYGFTNQEQTEFGHRNHGIRKWNETSGQVEFTEHDVFGGTTEGVVRFEDDDIYYSYEYGGSKVTDAWIKLNDHTYQFKVGSFSNGNWNQVYLDTEFHAMPIYTGSKEDYEALMKSMSLFSKTYMSEDHEGISDFYTEEGKIMPNGTRIIQGKEAIAARWKLPDETDILHHAIYPVEIHIMGDTAYDYGYYEGSTKVGDQAPSHWKGKYVIIWKKIDGKWLIDVDIWNRVNN